MKRDTPTRRAHRFAERLITAWLDRGEECDACQDDYCQECKALRAALDKLAQQHFERGTLT